MVRIREEIDRTAPYCITEFDTDKKDIDQTMAASKKKCFRLIMIEVYISCSILGLPDSCQR